jgi:oligo-1,6-glucosidase
MARDADGVRGALLPAALAVLLGATACARPERFAVPTTSPAPQTQRTWWKEAVVYQIYPRSFQDSDGDGIGDLPGIVSRLDYVKSLGIDAVWLNPVYASPNRDNGYDISDYRAIMKEFGTMADFDRLLAGLHQRRIKLFMDLVVNHCSDQHEWFRQARTSRDNPYYGYFHWWPAEKGAPPARWSHFDEKADAWEWNEATRSYYLHYFADSQPDLNWENPRLRREIYDMMRFWLDKGVDGFRLDAIAFISKDTAFPPLPPEYKGEWGKYYANGPHLHEYLQEMNREVLSRYDVATVAEAFVSVEHAMKLVDPDRRELNMAYHFDGVGLGYLPNEFKMPDPRGYDLRELKRVYTRWDEAFATKGWGTMYLGNHDQPRMVTRWGNDSPEFRALSSKMLTTFVLGMRATPYYYFGDELGMSNVKFDRLEDYDDIEVKTNYAQVQARGGDLGRFLEGMKISARDNGRTPFQWDASPNAGFTTGRPWLKVNPNFPTVNVAAEEKDPDSPLHYFRRLVRLRRENPVLVYGKYRLLDADNPDVYSFTRELDGKSWAVLLNFRSRTASAATGLDLKGARLVIGNYPEGPPEDERLRPYEARLYELKTSQAGGAP